MGLSCYNLAVVEHTAMPWHSGAAPRRTRRRGHTYAHRGGYRPWLRQRPSSSGRVHDFFLSTLCTEGGAQRARQSSVCWEEARNDLAPTVPTRGFHQAEEIRWLGGGATEERKISLKADVLLELYKKGERNFRGAKLEGAELRAADLKGIRLNGAILRMADLREAKLYRADLRGANLYKADLRGADLRKCNLRGANLTKTDLSGADLRNASLHEAHLREADLSEADLHQVKLKRANLMAAEVTEKQLARAKSLKQATLPDGTVHK